MGGISMKDRVCVPTDGRDNRVVYLDSSAGFVGLRKGD